MAKKAKKKSAVSRAVKKAAYVHGEFDSKSCEKDDAREEGQEEIFPALIQATVPEVQYRRHPRWHAP